MRTGWVLAIGAFALLSSCFEVTCKRPRKKTASNDDNDIDPVSSWMSFVKQSTKRSRLDKKSDRKGRKVMAPPLGMPGPPGPRGPAGPPGAVVTEAAMMAEFRSLVRDSADRRAARFAGQPLGLMAAGVPDVISAFFIQLQDDMILNRKSKTEIHLYKVHGAGTFIRGQGIELDSGRFVAPYTAIYHFQATLHVSKPKEVNLKPRDSVQVMICVNSDCVSNISLKYRKGLSTNSKTFTINVSGMLYLMANQYTSVIVENLSSNVLTIDSASSFSGSLMGA